MTALKIAAQLYTIRQFTQTRETFAESMAKIRRIGYHAVQISAIGPITDEDVRWILDDNGLDVCITHIGYATLWNDTDNVIKQHQLWKCKNAAIGSLPQEYRDGEAGFRRFAKEASEVGKRFADAGMTFSYHNHNFEFVRFGEKTALEILYEESDPRYLMAELDTYWVQHGGGSPSAWIRKMKQRMPVVHLKDMAVTQEDGSIQQVMAEIGQGNLDWEDILKACEEAGVEWCAVEQDICQRDPFESLQISYTYLKGKGLD
jgi:sugar phosphate isomerase/epimerase